MKRHSVFVRRFSLVFSASFAAIFSLFCVVGCKTSEVVRPASDAIIAMDVESLLLLDNKSSVYIRIPSNVDENLIPHILQNSIQGLSQNAASFVAEKMSVVYAGITRSRSSSSFQLVADCDFPSSLVHRAFSEKNGWTEEKIALKSSAPEEKVYSVYKTNGLSLSFVSDSKVCAGRNIDTMIEKYHTLAFPFEEASGETVVAGVGGTAAGGDEAVLSDDSSVVVVRNTLLLPKGVDSLKHGAYDYLLYDKGNPDGAIKFFTPRPQSFLPMLIGSTLNFNLVYACGEIFPDKTKSDQMVLRLELEFKDAKYIPFGRGALSVSFGLTESDVYLKTPTHLVVENIKISRDQLYRLLML